MENALWRNSDPPRWVNFQTSEWITFTSSFTLGFNRCGLPGLHWSNSEKEMGHACDENGVMRNVATAGRNGQLRMVATVGLSGRVANALG